MNEITESMSALGKNGPLERRVYQNHHIDSDRWDSFTRREDDIIIVTSIKSGTTWMQMIVRDLVFFRRPAMLSLNHLSPWLEGRRDSREEILNVLEMQRHRRFIKCHLPLDGLPFFPELKYLVVVRHPCDVFMSLWNHYSSYNQAFFDRVNAPGFRMGPEFEPPPKDPRMFWKNWMTKGWFPWETEGYPFWTNLRHTQQWWAVRDLPNVHFVHFNSLLENLAGEIGKIAEFLDIPLPSDGAARVAKGLTFSEVRKRVERFRSPRYEEMFRDGARSFFFKGTNGRWRDVLTEEDLELYQEARKRELTDDCANWLEGGPIQD